MRVDIPLRWVTGLRDPVIRPALHQHYHRFATDLAFEEVPGVGHWLIEQAPELALDRVRKFLMS